MKVDRRSFLSFVIGGAAGTALSPLPWKLMDDSSIWSQNWAWTPVPKDGEYMYEDTTCSLCPGGCGITVRKVDDRAVKIEGKKGHPVNDGGVCILGLSGLQYLYGPTRIKSPMKRAGERGEGKWEKISWDQAISLLSEKLGTIRKEGNPNEVACISGSDKGTVAQLLKRLMTAYGSPNFVKMPSAGDTYDMMINNGGNTARIAFDLENSDFVLSFGSGLIDGWGSPVRMFKAKSGLKDTKARVVQIEPRLSNSAAKADQWVPLNPGTEADLALGIAAVIISNNLHDHGLFSSGADSLGDFKKVLLTRYSPKAVSRITGVDENTISDLAMAFAKAKHPVAVCGRGKGIVPGALREVAAVNVLNALKSAINAKGGVWIVNEPAYIAWDAAQMDEIASKGVAQPRIDGAGQGKFVDTRHMANRMISAINENAAVKALLVANANPMYALPDTTRVKQAFDKVPFVVSFSSFMDETAAHADLLMPDHIYLERFEDVPAGAGVSKPMLGLSKPVVSPQFNTKHLGETIILTAKALGGDISASFPWEDYETCLQETLGDKWEALMENGVWVDQGYSPGQGQLTFAALSDAPVEASGDVNTFPLELIPYDSIRLSSGYYGDSPFMIKTVADTILSGKDQLVEVNPDTAKAAGLSEGGTAVLETPVGKAKVRVHLFDGIKPGVVAMPRGLGHTAYDKYLAGKGVNVNDLIGPVKDPATGHDAAWGIRAKLAKA